MKINFVLPGIGISGGVRVVFEYANRLSDRGHDVTVIYPTVPSRAGDLWTDWKERVSQVLAPVKRIVTSDRPDWFDLNVPVKRIPSIDPLIVERFQWSIPDADVTIATSWKTAYAVAGLNESKGRKAYFVQHYEIWKIWNSDAAWEQVSELTDDPSRYPVEMVEVAPPSASARKEKSKVDGSYKLPLTPITISSWLEELLEEKFDRDVCGVVPNSVNHDTFYPDPTGDREELMVLISARGMPWKGEREARQLAKALDERTDVDVHTFGSDPSDSAYPSAVTHHPDLTDAELRGLYSDADIFVFPSWVEGGGLPPLEAMACRTAVVATNVGGVPDYGDDGENMIVVPPRDGDKLVEVVVELTKDNTNRKALAIKGRESVQSYTWADATDSIEVILQDNGIVPL